MQIRMDTFHKNNDGIMIIFDEKMQVFIAAQINFFGGGLNFFLFASNCKIDTNAKMSCLWRENFISVQ